MPLERHQRAHRHVHCPQLGGAAQIRQVDDETRRHHIGADLAHQFYGALGGAVAHQLSAGFVPIRKKGKLPYETVRVAYSLEYGLDEDETPYIRDALLKERVKHWRTQLGAAAV